jgi:6-methylsalicylate decarboxylase
VRIDTHVHLVPQEYQETLEARGLLNYPIGEWRLELTDAFLDAYAIDACVLSLAPLGVWFGDAGLARELARLANEQTAAVVATNPRRYAGLAVVPLPDIDAALEEIAYALDVLKLDGIGLLTSYAGKLLGDPAFAPVMEELNRRKAIVYVHPTVAPCCAAVIPGTIPQMEEFPFDTTRTITSLMLNGTIAKNRDIRFIFSHGGGTIPFIAERLEHTTRGRVPGGVEPTLRTLYYDTASAASGPAMAALMKLVPVSQILFGSDYPFVDTADGVKGLAKIGLSKAQAHAIDRGNAERLLPRLKA